MDSVDLDLRCPQKLLVSSSVRKETLSNVLHFHKRQILDSFELKEFAEDNLKLDGHGGKFFKKVENTVEKREIAR